VEPIFENRSEITDWGRSGPRKSDSIRNVRPPWRASQKIGNGSADPQNLPPVPAALRIGRQWPFALPLRRSGRQGLYEQDPGDQRYTTVNEYDILQLLGSLTWRPDLRRGSAKGHCRPIRSAAGPEEDLGIRAPMPIFWLARHGWSYVSNRVRFSRPRSTQSGKFRAVFNIGSTQDPFVDENRIGGFDPVFSRLCVKL